MKQWHRCPLFFVVSIFLIMGTSHSMNIDSFKTYALHCETFDELKMHLYSAAQTNENYYNSLKSYFKYNPKDHISFIGQLEEKLRRSREEIAKVLSADFYILRGQSLINAIKSATPKDTIATLIEYGADINYSIWSIATLEKEGKKAHHIIKGVLTPLWYAYKQPDVFSYLLENGALPDQARDVFGRSVLVRLCEKYTYEYFITYPTHLHTAQKQIKLLLEKGANPYLLDGQSYNLSGYKYTQPAPRLQKVIEESKRQRYLSSGKLKMWSMPYNLSMHRKIQCISPAKLPDLIQNNLITFFPNRTDYKRNTILHHLIRMHTYRTDVAGKDEGCRYYIFQAIKTLLEKNANPNQPDGLGNTALHLALNDVEPIHLVTLLLKHKADPTLHNDALQTPLSIATKKELGDIEMEFELAQ